LLHQTFTHNSKAFSGRTFRQQLDLSGGNPFDERELKTLGSMGEALCRRLAA